MKIILINMLLVLPLFGSYAGPTKDVEEKKRIKKEVERTNKEVWENYKKKRSIQHWENYKKNRSIQHKK